VHELPNSNQIYLGKPLK